MIDSPTNPGAADPGDRAREAEAALHRSEARLRDILENTFDGIWDWNVAEGTVFFSPRYYRILGYEPGGFPAAFDTWRALLHPDDLPHFEAALQRHFEDSAVPYHVEFRMRHKDGSWVWIEAHGSVVERDPDGKPLRMVGTHSDITPRKNAQTASLRSEKRLEHVIQSLAEGVVALDAHAVIVQANSRAHEILGFADGTLAGTVLFDPGWTLRRPDGSELPQEELPSRQTIQDGQTRRNVEFEVVAPDGRQIWISGSSTVLETDEHGNPAIVVVSFSDITDRRRQEEAVVREKVVLEAVFNSVPGMIYLYDGDGRLVRWNRKHELMTGYGPEELAGMRLLDWYKDDPKSLAAVTAGINTTIETGYGEAEGDLQRKDGSTIPMFFTAALLAIDGKPHFAGLGLDLTERRKQEQDIRRSEAMYRLLAENSLDMVTRHDMQGNYLWASPSARTLLGFETEEMVGRSGFEMIHPDDQALVAASLAKILEGPVTSKVVYRHLTKSGKWIWVESMSRALHDQGTGEIVELQVSTRDITERKLAEDRYRSLFENLTTGFALHEVVQDESGKVVDYRFLEVNPTYEKLTGLTADRILGRTVKEILPGTEPYWIETFGKVAITGEALRYENYSSELGRWYETSAYRPATGQFAVLLSDITDRKHQEAALRDSEYFFKESQRASSTGSYRLHMDTGFWDFSETLGTILGIDRNFQNNIEGWLDLVHPDDREAMQHHFQVDVIAKRGRFNKEYRIVRPVDGEVRWVYGQGELVTDEAGNLQHMIGTIRDVTDRRKAEDEIRELNASLERKVEERTAELRAAIKELESFSYSISHDLRSPLRAIDGFSKALGEDFGSLIPPEGTTYIERIRSASQRMGQLIDDLLELSKSSRVPVKKESVDISWMAGDILDSLQDFCPGRSLVRKIDPSIVVEGDTVLVRSILENLLGNAWKYSGERKFPRSLSLSMSSTAAAGS